MDYHHYFVKPDREKDYEELKNVCFFINRLNDENFCPFAAHAIFPYIFSFAKGSWFRWEKSKNSVVVQCPNPISCVAFRVTKETSGAFSAEVISIKNECRTGYKVGDVFKLSHVEDERLKGAWCYLNTIDSLSLTVVSHNRRCRYYQKPARAISFDKFTPARFCVSAYYVVYPYALSLLYDGMRSQKTWREEATVLFSCPNNSDCIQMQVTAKRNIFSPFLSFLEKALRSLGRPRDVLDKSIEIKVVRLQGSCPRNLTVGRIAQFNLFNRKELCPALFYTLFPYLVLLDRKMLPYWGRDKSSIDIHCPDAAAEIVYRLGRK